MPNHPLPVTRGTPRFGLALVLFVEGVIPRTCPDPRSSLMSKAAAGIVALAGLVFMAVFLWPR